MKKPYHHGDLREKLLAAATQLIASGGVESLSIRKLADQVGVSRTAPYHHFKDKNELLCAIAEHGFQQQDQLLSDIVTNPDHLSPAQLFQRYMLTYIQFAHSEQETYDLMYGREIWKTGQPTVSLQQVSKHSFRLWLEWIEELQQADIFASHDPALRIAQSSWASLHGLCRLFNDGIYVNRDDLEAIACTTLNLLLKPGILDE